MDRFDTANILFFLILVMVLCDIFNYVQNNFVFFSIIYIETQGIASLQLRSIKIYRSVIRNS